MYSVYSLRFRWILIWSSKYILDLQIYRPFPRRLFGSITPGSERGRGWGGHFNFMLRRWRHVYWAIFHTRNHSITQPFLLFVTTPLAISHDACVQFIMDAKSAVWSGSATTRKKNYMLHSIFHSIYVLFYLTFHSNFHLKNSSFRAVNRTRSAGIRYKCLISERLRPLRPLFGSLDPMHSPSSVCSRIAYCVGWNTHAPLKADTLTDCQNHPEWHSWQIRNITRVRNFCKTLFFSGKFYSEVEKFVHNARWYDL